MVVLSLFFFEFEFEFELSWEPRSHFCRDISYIQWGGDTAPCSFSLARCLFSLGMTGSPGVAQKSSAVTKYILFTFLCVTLVLPSAFLFRLHTVGSIGEVRAQADEVRLHKVCAECGSD